MDSYVVRVYKRGSTDPDEIIGIVEDPVTRRETSFTSFEELRHIMGRTVRTERKKRQRKGESKEG